MIQISKIEWIELAEDTFYTITTTTAQQKRREENRQNKIEVTAKFAPFKEEIVTNLLAKTMVRVLVVVIIIVLAVCSAGLFRFSSCLGISPETIFCWVCTHIEWTWMEFNHSHKPGTRPFWILKRVVTTYFHFKIAHQFFFKSHL